MTNEQLEANRKCPYGGGCKDCPCEGLCRYMAQQPTMTQQMLAAERSERSERGE